jgi:hypothetical protein
LPSPLMPMMFTEYPLSGGRIYVSEPRYPHD